MADTAYRWVFVNTGLLEKANGMMANTRAVSQVHSRDFQYYLGQAYVRGVTAHAGAHVAAVVIATFLGFVDGLGHRDVRRFGVGRESSFLYHRANGALVSLVMLPWVVYLALPVSQHPLLMVLPSAALLGLAVNLTAGSFKKYL